MLFINPQLSDKSLSAKYGFTKKGLFMFLQRWNELFDYKTIDSYQFRTNNAHWILKETLETISLVKSGKINYANLPPLINETKDTIMIDICLKKHNLPLWGRLINNSYKEPKADNKPALMRLEYQLKHALSLFSTKYLHWLLEDLKEAIDNDELEKIDILTGFFASELVNLGWSPRSLSRLVKHLCFKSGTGTYTDMWVNFAQEISTPIQTFDCFYPCKGNISLLTDAKIDIKLGSDLIKQYPNSNIHISPTSTYIHVNSVARYHDLHSAVENSKLYMSQVQALAVYNETNITIDKSIIVIFPGGNKSLVYNINDTAWKSTSRVDHPYFVTIKGINDVLNKDTFDPDSQAKFANLLKQYYISLEALSPETWFANLWIALESLVVTGQHGSIIEHVRKLVPSILCSIYVDHLLRNFLNDYNECGITPTYLGVGINTLRPGITEVDKLLNVLRSPTELASLLGLCSNYSLLEIRCKKLAESMKNNESILELIVRHNRNLSWHLQRLYRVRNSLIHTSKSKAKILPLTVHLNHYLRSVVSQVVYRICSNNFNSLEELFAAFEDNYLATIEILEDKTPYSNELVLKGALF